MTALFSSSEVLETIRMVQAENLDIRTVTLGISLRDCATSDLNTTCHRIYDKVRRKAERLVPVAEEIEARFGIPIVNKRIAVTPISLVGEPSGAEDYLPLAETLDRAAAEVGVNFVGGFSALVHKGFTSGDHALINSLPQALAQTERVCASVNVGTTRAGLNMDAIRTLGLIIKETARLFCNAPEDNPFMAGAFHGAGEPDCVINVGVSGPGVVRAAIAKASPEDDITAIADIIKKTAFKITRMGQLVAQEASRRLCVPFGIVDLSLAPTPAIGDSVADILEAMGLEQCGAHGTTAALALLNDAVKKGGVMASSHVGGLSGAFIPVSEDQGMIAAAKSGALSITKLEAMTAVCSVGLDMIVVPGDITPEIISGIIADEAAIGMVNSKTTAVRLIV
jgi:uncharacterized protein (UPF0210 family)